MDIKKATADLIDMPPPARGYLPNGRWGSIESAVAFMYGCLERSLDFLDSISLDNVANLDIVVTLDIETAVHT